MATPDILIAPPGMDTPYQQPSADIIQFPHRSDGDFHSIDPGYELVPAEIKTSSLSDSVRYPIALTRGIGKATAAMAQFYVGNAIGRTGSSPERRIIEVNGTERVAAITEPKTTTSEGTLNEVLMPGLTEIDMGSALLLHEEYGEQHPDRRIITIATPGVSLSGKSLSIAEGFNRPLEETAAENVAIIREIAGDEPTSLNGVSLGSFISVVMGSYNLSLNPKDQLSIDGIKLLSSAVGARDVPEAEKFRKDDASDEEFIADVTDRFFKHMHGDIARMIRDYPEKAGQCAAVLGAYALAPHKLPNRAAAILGNLRGVQEGIDWEDLKNVAQAQPVHVLGGELDPLMKEQLSQWQAIKKIAPRTKVRVLEGRGHAMTMDTAGTVEHVAQMEIDSLAA